MYKASPADSMIVELWKKVYPSAAYTIGWPEYAGKLFIPSKANIETALAEVKKIRKQIQNDHQAKILDSIEFDLQFEEPQTIIEGIVGTIFNHLTKEGLNEDHMVSLVSNVIEALDASIERFKDKKVPTGVKVLTLYSLNGILEILDVVKDQAKNQKLKSLCNIAKAKAAEFVSMFKVEGFTKGTYQEVRAIFEREKFDLGREKIYKDALKKWYDYDEGAEELEQNALRWIQEELPVYREVIRQLSQLYSCEPAVDEVEKKIESRVRIEPAELVQTTAAIRNVVQRFINEKVVRINPKYDTRLIETPSYLTGTLPTAAAGFFDSITEKPFQLYFITTDRDRDPMKSLASIINTLVHEEYGHCVHHSNSSVGFVEELNILDLLPTSFQGPVSEGLAFNRELEFIHAIKELEDNKELSAIEREYVNLMERYGGLHLCNLEVEYETRKWRLIRFLRVVGDVRVNTGKQTLFEFIDWAHAYTGVPAANIYFQLFPAHESIGPGYATCYAVVGEKIRELESRIKEKNRRIEFSTYLSSIGSPPTSIYRKKLEDHLKKIVA
ncbi:MAG: hypothetical protein QXQ39_05990 [Conexivisphaerales archaeon]